MRKTISEVAKQAGVSVRTLHYYDKIGLLTPGEIIIETGYRYYDEKDITKLQQILFYRELDFPLKEIKSLMNSPNYDMKKVLKQQRKLLMLKRARLDEIIALLDANLKGDKTMSLKEFDMKEINDAKAKYAHEVESKWGDTSAYQESQRKTAGYRKDDWTMISEKMDSLLKAFAGKIGSDPAAPEVQALVADWKQFITDSYYECTDEILAGLGQMYIADERFTKNMDKFGKGTAKLMSQAIRVYCK